jgi:hypothetical protein
LPPPPTFLSHELIPPPLSSLAAAPPNPSEATKTKPEATEAKYESHREQEHANASRMDHSDAAPTIKPQQAQVRDSDRHSSGNNISDSTTDDNDTRLCDDGDAANNLTGRGTLGGCVWECDDGTCGSSSSSSLPSACATQGLDSINSNLAFDPGGNPFSNNGVGSEHNAIGSADVSSLSRNTLTYGGGGSSDNSSDSRFVHDPGGISFSNAPGIQPNATTISFRARVLALSTEDDDMQLRRPRRDRRLPARYRTGDFISTDTNLARDQLLDLDPVHTTPALVIDEEECFGSPNFNNNDIGSPDLANNNIGSPNLDNDNLDNNNAEGHDGSNTSTQHLTCLQMTTPSRSNSPAATRPAKQTTMSKTSSITSSLDALLLTYMATRSHVLSAERITSSWRATAAMSLVT